MNSIMIFEEKQVEVFELNGQVLFNPYDVGACLGLTKSTVRDNISSMNEKQVVKLTNSKVDNIDFRKLHNTGENFLTESGVYKLIFKSRKEEAERFQDWVTDEVLPSIRKHGGYLTPQKIEEALLNPDTLIQLATTLKEEQEKNKKLLIKNSELSVDNQIMKPKADYFDELVDRTLLTNIRETAKQLGIKEKEFINFLLSKNTCTEIKKAS